MGAMRIGAVDRYGYCPAHLWPPRAAGFAIGAAVIVMHHHPPAELRVRAGYARADGDDHAAGLVPRDYWCDGGVARSSVEMQIAAAHAGGFDLQHHFARAGGRIGNGSEFKRAVATENNTAHQIFSSPIANRGPVVPSSSQRWS